MDKTKGRFPFFVRAKDVALIENCALCTAERKQVAGYHASKMDRRDDRAPEK